MKKILSLAALCCLFVGVATAQTNYQVKQSNYEAVEVAFSAPLPQVAGIELGEQQFTSLRMDGFAGQNQVGRPDLPAMVKLVEIPLGEGLTYDIVEVICDTLDGTALNVKNPIVPAQASRSKSDRSDFRLAMDGSVYGANDFVGDDVITLEKIGVARDANLAEVHFNPIKWNPTTNQIVIYKKVVVRIRMTEPDVAATIQMKNIHHSGAFNLTSDVINHIGSPKDVSNCAPLHYLIVAHSSFRGQFENFVEWKKRQGFTVEVAYTDDTEVGTDTAHIRTFIKNHYTNATAENPAPTFVLLIGDNEQIPAYYCVEGSGWSTSTHYSDLYYMTWTRGDIIPDCFYGRFSAQNLSQLTPQIEKTLYYEQYAFTDPNFLTTGILVAGEDQGMSGDNAYKCADPAMDYIAKTYVNANNGYNSVYYYKNNTNFAPDGVTVNGSSQTSASATTLRNLYNEGAGWINYSAHGDVTEWYKPNFTTAHVHAMTNNGKPGIMIGSCCLTNSFQADECLGEALLRKGNNAGAVSYIGGSDVTYWSEDFYWAVGLRNNISNTMNPSYDSTRLGGYDRMFHTHNESFDKWYNTSGALVMAGNMAVQSSTSSLKKHYWEVYHLMGDPSLMPWLGLASDLSVNYNPSILMVGSTTLSVEAVPHAYVALTDANHDLLDAAYADANGVAVLNFGMITTPGQYELAVSAQNYKPFFAQIDAIVADGPFLMIDSIAVVGNPTAGDTVSFNLHLHNIGNATPAQYSVEFLTNGSHLFTLNGGQDTMNNAINEDDTYLLNGGESRIWSNVADQTMTNITAIVRWGTHNTEMSRRNFSFTINAPQVKAVNHNFGSIAANQNTTLTINNRNLGHSTAKNVLSNLVCIDPLVTISNGQQSTNNLAANSNWDASYSIHFNGEIPTSGVMQFYQMNDFDGFRTIDTISLAFGANSDETFETGNFTNLNWIQNSYPWGITNSNVYAGNYCAKSYNFGNTNNASSELSITWTSSIDDSLSFYHKVSSESGYDWFRFYIDGTKMEESSGPINDWERSAYMIPAGTHTFKWAYEKDYSASNGSDCAWIDNINFPMTGTCRNYMMDTICEGESYEFNGNVLTELTPGDHFYQDSANHQLHFLQLTVSAVPLINITASATQIRSGEPVILEANGGDRYLWSTGENQSIIRSYPRSSMDYVVTGWNNGCSQNDTIRIDVNGSVGILDIETMEMTLFPNPTTTTLNVECKDMVEVSIFNSIGQMIRHQNANGDSMTLNVSNLNSGAYMIQITTSNGFMTTQKFIKK